MKMKKTEPYSKMVHKAELFSKSDGAQGKLSSKYKGTQH